jgi:hypothetical protein
MCAHFSAAKVTVPARPIRPPILEKPPWPRYPRHFRQSSAGFVPTRRRALCHELSAGGLERLETTFAGTRNSADELSPLRISRPIADRRCGG